ncbi:MAG: hypothetical protein ACYS21_11900 [Planctomycetota bacterium]|jgi:hypothetical protein
MNVPYIISFTARTLLYVDANDGDDANNGTTWALAKKTISSAITAGADEIIVRNDHATERRLAGSVSLTSEAVKEVRVIGHYHSTAKKNMPIIGPGWIYHAGDFSLTAGKSITFECSCTDALAEVLVGDPELITLASGEGGKVLLTEQVSANDVESNPGSWYKDGGANKLYVSLPDSNEDYFTNGGDIFGHGSGGRGADCRYGNILHLENIAVWGNIYALWGGRIFMNNVQQRLSEENGIYVNGNASVFANSLDVAYNYLDGVNVRQYGYCGLCNATVSHNGTGTTDQCLTCHNFGTIEAERVIANDAAGSVGAFVGASRIYLKDFLLSDSGSTRYVLEFQSEGSALIQDGTLDGGTYGLWVDNTGSDLKTDTRIKLKNVDFRNNSTYDVGVESGTAATVLLENCKYDSGDPVNNNYTDITTRRVEVDTSGQVTLASDGLDSVATTEPSGVASDFREMLVQLWRRFFIKSTATASALKTYKDDDSVCTTQDVSFDGTTKTVDDAA